tara:strand:+ start:60 stop:530 length:471 start_codon:yes stop_codon:yes gene_type:complete
MYKRNKDALDLYLDSLKPKEDEDSNYARAIKERLEYYKPKPPQHFYSDAHRPQWSFKQENSGYPMLGISLGYRLLMETRMERKSERFDLRDYKSMKHLESAVIEKIKEFSGFYSDIGEYDITKQCRYQGINTDSEAKYFLIFVATIIVSGAYLIWA